MADTGGTSSSGMFYWLSILFSGAGAGVLGHFSRDWRGHKKDAGELANDLLEQCVEDIKSLKGDNDRCRTETAELRAISLRNDIVIRLVVPELQRVAPYSTSLQQARDLLGSAFPVPFPIPDDMTEMLNRIP